MNVSVNESRVGSRSATFPWANVLWPGSLTTAVRAVQFEADGSVKLIQVPEPQPGPEDLLVQVLAVGVCRTDLHLLDEVTAGERSPLISGHEIAGRIATVGSDV